MFRVLSKFSGFYPVIRQSVNVNQQINVCRLMCSVKIQTKEVKSNEDQHLNSVDQLYGHFYGPTDASDPDPLDNRPRRTRRRSLSRESRPNKFENSETRTPKVDPWNMTVLKFHDPTVSRLILNARANKKQRKNNGMVLEGKRLIKDAIKTGLKASSIVVSDPSILNYFEEYRETNLKGCEIYRAPQKDLSVWSSLTTCPGIIGIFNCPINTPAPENCLPITVICDNIREPNNLGSIFRVCAALPCKKVVVMKGCADPWEAKSLRGGAGGQFHIPVEYPVKWEEINKFFEEDKPTVFIADNQKNSKLDLKTIDQSLMDDIKGSVVVVIGGETHGISREAYSFAQEISTGTGSSNLHIPMSESVESMNTASALAVILYELRRQLKQKLSEALQTEVV